MAARVRLDGQPMSVTLADAVDRVRIRWNDRHVPIRLHEHATGDDGAPRLSPAFMRYLDAKAWATYEIDERDTCYHPRLTGRDDPFACPDCRGDGTKYVRRTRYLWPMWAALSRLAHEPPDQGDVPPPVVIVLAVAAARWDWRRAAARLGLHEREDAELLVLSALRKLEVRYRESPLPRPSWVDLSESQRKAEGE